MEKSEIPESFQNAMNDMVVGRIVPLDVALNKPYDSDVSALELHNHVLKVANDELSEKNNKMEETLCEIWQCFEMRSEIYYNDWEMALAFANKAKDCLKDIKSELIKD